MVELDVKQQVLVAIYTECQRDLPDMKSVKADVIGIPITQIFVALDKLENEGLINGVKFVRGDNGAVPIMAVAYDAKMTSFGIDYV